VGGNLLQRPRCWYFRNRELVCLKKGGSECLAEKGNNKYHAIFGGGPSFIVHPSTLATALRAFDVKISVLSASGDIAERDLGDLFVTPDLDPTKEHSLADGEILVDFDLPPAPEGMRSIYLATKENQSHDWPLVEVAASCILAEGKMTKPRMVLGHVAPIPWVAKEAAAALDGKAPDPGTFSTAADAELVGARPLEHNKYKVSLARGLMRQGLHAVTNVPLPE
jgi:xanthine dehydrogenase YagS FAD-binding subunit